MKVLVLVSGGLDSSTCLAQAVADHGRENVVALSMYYGQKHERELRAAADITKYYGVKHISLDLAPIFESSDCALLKHSALAIPEKSYDEQVKELAGKPVTTYVPFRNGLFISCAASIAAAEGCGEVIYGAHADDAAGNAYPDCSKAFNDAMSAAVYEGSGQQVRLCAPFVGQPKSAIVKAGLALGVPYELTWSCYEGGEKPCGKCGTCLDREKAFRENGKVDPLYE